VFSNVNNFSSFYFKIFFEILFQLNFSKLITFLDEKWVFPVALHSSVEWIIACVDADALHSEREQNRTQSLTELVSQSVCLSVSK